MGDRMKAVWERRERRERRVRRGIRLGSDRPRLSVFRSHRHLVAQLIDDGRGVTLAHASTLEEDLRGKAGDKVTKTEEAKRLGAAIAARAKERGITRVVFDRGRFAYHGRLRALAEAARAAGLEF
jgi:large subunit ribosomal protein L18